MSISIKSRKAKGRTLQKWCAKKISELLDIPYGKDELIASREMGQNGVDVRLIGEAKKRFPFSIECKNSESWDIPGFIRQAKKNQLPDTDWLVVMKKNHHEPIVMIDADAFFKIIDYSNRVEKALDEC